MKEIPEIITDKEVNEIIKRIAKPVYKFVIKKIENELLNGYYKGMSVNCFVTIVANSMANVDGNLLRWLATAFQKMTGKEAPFDNIKKHFYDVLKEHCESKLGKH